MRDSKPAVIRMNQGNVNKLIKVNTSYVFWIITVVMKINDDETNYAQLLEIWINDKTKMDRRFFPMQDIKVRQS